MQLPCTSLVSDIKRSGCRVKFPGGGGLFPAFCTWVCHFGQFPCLLLPVDCRDSCVATVATTIFCRHNNDGMSTVKNSRLSRHCRDRAVDNVSLKIILLPHSDRASQQLLLSRTDYCGTVDYYKPYVQYLKYGLLLAMRAILLLWKIVKHVKDGK